MFGIAIKLVTSQNLELRGVGLKLNTGTNHLSFPYCLFCLIRYLRGTLSLLHCIARMLPFDCKLSTSKPNTIVTEPNAGFEINACPGPADKRNFSLAQNISGSKQALASTSQQRESLVKRRRVNQIDSKSIYTFVFSFMRSSTEARKILPFGRIYLF